MMATFFGILFCIVCVLLIMIILLQRGRGGGLAGAFGGAGGHSAFGAKTGDVFTWVTVAFVAIYLLLAVALNFLFVPTAWTPVETAEQQTTAQQDEPQATQPGTPAAEGE